MQNTTLRYTCNKCNYESSCYEGFSFSGPDGFTCNACIEIELEKSKEREKIRVANSPIERDLINRGFGSIEGYSIIPCIEEGGIAEAVEFDTPGTNYWDVVNYGRVLKTFRTNLEDALQFYLELGSGNK